MKSKFNNLLALILCCNIVAISQNVSISILAYDSLTHELGAAGFSCNDLSNYPGYSDDFYVEILPGVGIISTQGEYNPTNQLNARNQLLNSLNPNQTVIWLFANDANQNPLVRNYNFLSLFGPFSSYWLGSMVPQTRSFYTGWAGSGPANVRFGVSIAGNSMAGAFIIDSLANGFLNQQGDLACKLMSALQNAKIAGADNRCSTNGTSSLFAFLKVSQPTDSFGNPSFLVSVRTQSNSGVEPIDSLQTLFNLQKNCALLSSLSDLNSQELGLFQIYPNPACDNVTLTFNPRLTANSITVTIYDPLGTAVLEDKLEVISSKSFLNTKNLINGSYYLKVDMPNHTSCAKPFLINRE